jgi:iron complex outermembrane receptor protein
MNQTTIVHENTDIAFSPGMILSSNVTYVPLKGLELALVSKFVGKQFLDNTSNDDRSLPSFLVHDLRAAYTFTGWKGIDHLTLMAAINNILDEMYAPSGYTYSYISGAETITDNYNYPQAGRHFTVGARLRF